MTVFACHHYFEHTEIDPLPSGLYRVHCLKCGGEVECEADAFGKIEWGEAFRRAGHRARWAAIERVFS